MPWNVLRGAIHRDGVSRDAAWETIEAVAPEDAEDGRLGKRDAAIPFEIPATRKKEKISQ